MAADCPFGCSLNANVLALPHYTLREAIQNSQLPFALPLPASDLERLCHDFLATRVPAQEQDQPCEGEHEEKQCSDSKFNICLFSLSSTTPCRRSATKDRVNTAVGDNRRELLGSALTALLLSSEISQAQHTLLVDSLELSAERQSRRNFLLCNAHKAWQHDKVFKVLFPGRSATTLNADELQTNCKAFLKKLCGDL